MTDDAHPNPQPPRPFEPEAFPPELHDLLDGRLDDDAADALRARLAAEPALHEAWEELRRIQTWVREVGPQGASLEPPSALREGLKTRLAALAADAPAASDAHHGQQETGFDETGPEASRPRATAPSAGVQRPGRLMRTLTLSYAAAALVVVGFTVIYVSSMTPGDAPVDGTPTVVAEAPLDKDSERREDLDGFEETETVDGRAPDASSGAPAARGSEQSRRLADALEAGSASAAPTPKAARKLVPDEDDAPSGSGTSGAAGRDERRGGFARPGGSVPPDLREPSDPAPPAGEASDAKSKADRAPRRARAAPPEARQPSSERPPGASPAPPARSSPTRPSPAASSPTSPSPGGPPPAKGPRVSQPPAKPRSGAPSAPASGAWGQGTRAVERLSRQLAAGDVIYVLETDDPARARAELAALLDAPSAGGKGYGGLAPRGAGSKKTAPKTTAPKTTAPENGESGDRPPRAGARRSSGGGGGAGEKAKDGQPGARADRLYRVQAQQLAGLEKQLRTQQLLAKASSGSSVDSTFSRALTPEVAARLRARLAVDRRDGRATFKSKKRVDRGAPAASDGEASKDDAGENDADKAEADVAGKARDTEASSATRAKSKRRPRVRILIIKRK